MWIKKNFPEPKLLHKTGFRPVNGRFMLVLLRNNKIPQPNFFRSTTKPPYYYYSELTNACCDSEVTYVCYYDTDVIYL